MDLLYRFLCFAITSNITWLYYTGILPRSITRPRVLLVRYASINQCEDSCLRPADKMSHDRTSCQISVYSLIIARFISLLMQSTSSIDFVVSQTKTFIVLLELLSIVVAL